MAQRGQALFGWVLSDEYWSWGKNCPPGVRVIHEVCHIFDLCRWFSDSDPESIYCVDSRPDDEVFVMKMASGCVCSIMNSGYVTMDLPKERVEIVSDLGAVTVEEFVELRSYGYPEVEPVFRVFLDAIQRHAPPELAAAGRHHVVVGDPVLVETGCLGRVHHLRDGVVPVAPLRVAMVRGEPSQGLAHSTLTRWRAISRYAFIASRVRRQTSVSGYSGSGAK